MESEPELHLVRPELEILVQTFSQELHQTTHKKYYLLTKQTSNASIVINYPSQL